MTDREPPWLAGYWAGMDAESDIAMILVPDNYTGLQKSNFVSGFLVGAQQRRNNELMNKVERAQSDG